MDPHSFKISTGEWVHLEHVSVMSQLKGLKKGGSVKCRLRTIVQIGMNNMVGQSCSCGSVVIYLLLCVIFSTPLIRKATYGSQTGQPSVFGSWKMHNSSEYKLFFLPDNQAKSHTNIEDGSKFKVSSSYTAY